jgi:hypothetical protein
MRWCESALYQGPETEEKVFEREESYQGPHESRSQVNKMVNGNEKLTGGKVVWYKLYYDSKKKRFIRKFYNKTTT